MSKTSVVPFDAGTLESLSDELKGQLTQFAGEGLESLDPEGFTIPFLKIVQGLSPERDKGAAEFIPGAEEGLLFDSVSRELFESVEVIPAHVQSRVFEWVPRNKGGGFVAEYRNREEAEEYVTPGNELRDTITYAVLYRPSADAGWRPAMIGFDGTKLKVARSWNTQMNTLQIPVEQNGEVVRVNPPIFMTQWRLGTVRQENNHGVFYNFTIQGIGLVQDSEAVATAKDLREAVNSRPIRGKDGDVTEPEVGEGGSDAF